MTATGAPEPDDRYLFTAITQDLDIDAAQVAAQLAAEAELRRHHDRDAAEQKTAAETPDPAKTPEPPAETSVPQAPPSSPAPEGEGKTAAPTKRNKSDTAVDVKDKEQPDTKAPARTIRTAIVDWVDRRGHSPRGRKTKTTSEEEEITTGAFVVVGIITIVVAGLAFALSFDMMRVAAKHYGWTEDLANLFPVIIDVGAVGGTFMGSISVNATYRRTGLQILIVTLVASVLFNLVGHDIKGTSVLGLPAEWKWTGPVAAIMIPMLLAAFVHAFSKALKTFFDQRRAQKARAEAAKQGHAEQQRLERERQDAQREITRQEAAQRQAALTTPLPTPASVKLISTTATASYRPAPAPRQRTEPPVKQPKPVKPVASANKPASTPGARKLTSEIAMEWAGNQPSEVTSTDIINHFAELGFDVPDGSTVRRWKKKEN